MFVRFFDLIGLPNKPFQADAVKYSIKYLGKFTLTLIIVDLEKIQGVAYLFWQIAADQQLQSHHIVCSSNFYH